MRSILVVVSLALLIGCASLANSPNKTEPIVSKPWDIVRIGTYNNSDFARLFTEIGGYEAVNFGGNLVGLVKGDEGAQIILEQLPPDAPQARPPDAKSWEPGCYWSLMMRAKNIPSIVEDANALGWEPKTPVAYLEFGPSKLNVVVLTHQETGAQIQLYERLTTPLPEDYPEFKRFGVPFNIMQMASNRDETYKFFTEKLGFATWYHGEPFVSEKEEIMPLGIPVKLTTTVPYRASIVSPLKGMETGRFEMIEVMGSEAGLTGRNFANNCNEKAVGITQVEYIIPVGWKDIGWHNSLHENFPEAPLAGIHGGVILKSPDGAEIKITTPQVHDNN